MFLFILGLILGVLSGTLTHALSGSPLAAVLVGAAVAILTWAIRRIAHWISDAAELRFNLFD